MDKNNLDFLEFNNAKDFDAFTKYLYSQGKEESIEDKKRHQSIMNSSKDLIALSMSVVRDTAKMIIKNGNYINFLSFEDRNVFEVNMIQGIVIAQIKDIDLQIKYLDKWVRTIDSWGLCDSVVATMKWLKKGNNKQKYFEYFYNLCYQQQEYVSRFGIVVLMSYYLDEEYIDKIYKMCIDVDQDKYYIQMAIAWLISFGFIKFKDLTYELFDKKQLSKFTQNKAISKCRDSFRVSIEDKEKLKEYRI